MAGLIKRLKSGDWWRERLPFILLIFVVVFHAILLFPELRALSPDLNDNVFHYSLCVSMLEEFETGGNLIDHWVPYWSIGYPVFHHYQHLPHLLVVLTYIILFKKVSLFFIFHAYVYLLLVFYPLGVYYSLRKLKFAGFPAAAGALFSLALSNINGYGFELGSFVWRGSGMFSQLWAMFLLPLALSAIYETLDKDKNYFTAVMLLVALTLSQVMFGLLAMITALLFLFINFNLGEVWERIKRLLVILGFFFLIIAYFMVPLLFDSPYHAHSTYDFPEKWNSYGARYVITHFLNGDILDYGRIAVLTVLAVLGLLSSLGRKAFRYRFAAAGFILWFLLYFGRPTWRILFNLIPLGSALHLHRLVTMVHFFGFILAGIGLTVIYDKVKEKLRFVPALILIILLCLPVFWERFNYLQKNNQWLSANKIAYQSEAPQFESMLNYIKQLPPGRVYPGRRANWGKDFKIGSTAVFYFLGQHKIPALSFLPFSWALSGDFSTNFHEYSWSHYNLFNVKYILMEKGKPVPSFARLIKSAGRFCLYAVPTTGYFDLVESPLAAYGNKNSIWNLMILWQRSPLVYYKKFISIFFDRKFREGYQNSLLLKDRWNYWGLNYLENGKRVKPPDQKPNNIFSVKNLLARTGSSRGYPGKIISEQPGKNIFSGKIKAEQDCLLLFKMTYHPGWQAYIDGEKKEKLILSPGLIGIKVKPGEHEIKFIYRAPGRKALLLVISFITVLVLFKRDGRRK